ncbi:MAG: hypothetical protein HXY22_10325 [Alphaproteobacteria bacterium]|nr:hypothetical protein [Alphaproteobacteria bacterium]
MTLGSLPVESVGLILVTILIFGAFVFGKAPFRAIGRIAYIATFPLRATVRLLQVLRLLPKGAAKGGRAGNGFIGASGLSIVGRAFWSQTETDLALFESEGSQVEGEVAAYDYTAEESGLARRGGFFRSIRILPRYMPDVNALDEPTAEIYRGQSDRFFSQQVPIYSNAAAFYEDVEGAVAIRMFRARDRRFYYLANEMRKIINANVKNLALALSLIVFGYAVIEMVLPREAQLDFAALIQYPVGMQVIALPLGAEVGRSTLNHILLDLLLFLFSLGLMGWFNFLFGRAQERNDEQMRGFLNRYLSRLADRYRQAIANARGVTVGDERDAHRAAATAQKWNKIILWMSFRTFFVETYLRNILFQIKRNSGYYIVGIPAVFALALSVFMLAAVSGDGSAGPEGSHSWSAMLFGILLVVSYVFILHRAMQQSMEMDQVDWLGFDNLQVHNAMDQIIGGYVEEIVHLRNRVRGGQG